ncbi:Mur ligase family protein [Fluviispira vulneris]|uniref:Mur ligase family protein n=1 Tax=Fluviispira vulneris TaxID=2763012 RepID=UPI0016453F21|nr:UDP-N-acetylmuramoyl-tripeptide--D-alanyl-D-alanine ligase [Fluviispira vulneris]
MWPLTGKEIYQAILEEPCPFESLEKISLTGVCTDSRKLKPQQFFVALQGENFDGHSYLQECFEKELPLALVSKDSKFLNELKPEFREKCIEVENVLNSFRQFAQFMRHRFPFPVIGIGGSNGKTTTKEMLASLLSGPNYKVTKTQKSENGFLGIAITLCQEEHNIKEQPHALVLEIGIDEMGAMQQHVDLSEPDISVLTALGPEHLERLKNWESAANEELFLFRNPYTTRIWQLADERILSGFTHDINIQYRGKVTHHKYPLSIEKDFLVIEKCEFDQEYTQRDFIFENTERTIVWEIINETPIKSEIKLEIFSKEGKLFTESNHIYEIPLPGKHNAANFALAFATAIKMKRTPREILEGWKNFVPPPMRSKISTLNNGTILFDDTYNASPMSIEAALNTIENKEWANKPKLIILGDMLDLGSESKYWHELLFHPLKNLQSTYLCLYGSAMYDCFKLLKETEETLIKENNTRIFWLATEEDPVAFLNIEGVDLSQFVILIKGSRGMKLDRLVKVIEEKCC